MTGAALARRRLFYQPWWLKAYFRAAIISLK
jgi:hypothetical protein